MNSLTQFGIPENFGVPNFFRQLTMDEIHTRYQIVKYLGKISYHHFFLAQDELAEREVMFHVTVHPNHIAPYVWQSWLGYYRSLAAWARHQDFLISTSDFAEISLTTTSSLQQQLLSQTPELTKDCDYVCYGVSDKTGWKFLAELHESPTMIAQGLLRILPHFQQLHSQGIYCGSLSPFHIWVSQDDPGQWALSQISIQLPFKEKIVEESDSPYSESGTEASPCSDLYALSLLMYEVLTGQKQLPASTDILASLRKCQTPEILALALEKGLSESPQQRWQDASEFYHALTPLFPDWHENISPRNFLLTGTWSASPEKEISQFLEGRQIFTQIWLGNDDACDWIATKIANLAAKFGLPLVPWISGVNTVFPLSALSPDIERLVEENPVANPGNVFPHDWDYQYQQQRSRFLRTLLQQYGDHGCLVFVPHLEMASPELLDYIKYWIANLVQYWKNTPTARIFFIATANATFSLANNTNNDEKGNPDNKMTSGEPQTLTSNTKTASHHQKATEPNAPAASSTSHESKHLAIHPLTNFLQKLSSDSFYQPYIEIHEFKTESASILRECLAHWLGLPQAPEKFTDYLAKITQNSPLYARLAVEILIHKEMLYHDQEWCLAQDLSKLPIPKSLDETISAWLTILSKPATEFLEVLGSLGCPLPIDMLYEIIPSDQVIPCLWELLKDTLECTADAQLIPRHFAIWKWLYQKKTLSLERWRKISDYLTGQHHFPYHQFILAQRAIAAGQKKAALLWLPKVLQYLTWYGLEDSLLAWWKQAQAFFGADFSENTSLAAQWAWQLKQYPIALHCYRQLASKKNSPLAAIRQVQLAMLEHAADTVGLIKKLRPICDDAGELYESWYYATKACWHRQQRQWDETTKNIIKALTLLESGWPEISEKALALECYQFWLQYAHHWECLSDAEFRIGTGLQLAQQNLQKGIQALFLFMLGQWQHYAGQYTTALENLQKSAELAYQNYDTQLQMMALLEMLEVYRWLGCYKKSQNLFNQIILLSKRDGIKSLRSQWTLAKARLSMESEPRAAEELFQESYDIAKRAIHTHAPLWIGYASTQLLAGLCDWTSLVAARSEKIALPLWGKACEFLQENYSPLRAIQVNMSKIKLDTMTEQPPDLILETCQHTAELVSQYHYEMYLAPLCYYQGLAYRSAGNISQALENFKRAYQTIESQTGSLSQDVREAMSKVSWVTDLRNVISSLTTELPWKSGKTKEDKAKRALESMAAQYRGEIEQQNVRSQNLQVQQYHRLLEINKKINSEHEPRKLLDIIMDTAIELTKAERGFLILTTTEQSKAFEVARNFEKEDISNPQFQVSHSITEEIIRTGLPILATDALQDERFDGYRSVADLKLHSILAVPLRIKEKIIGALYLDNRFEKAVFTPQHQELLEAFSDQAAIAIENARLLTDNVQKQEELRKNKEQIERLNQKLSLANVKLTQRVERREEELQEVRLVLQRNQTELVGRYQYHNLIGQSPAMQEIFRILEKITDKHISVLVYGESGTGKELVARAIHFSGCRKDKNFMSENCAAISDTLLASELFGHVKGAFTGAYIDKKGLFELADGGTLFLDEVGDMSPSMQANLLRVLETNVVRRVGGKDEIPVDVRVISASNKNLTELVGKGIFREDLLFRLKVVDIVIPPLRERKEDIPLLVEHFLKEFAQENKANPRTIDKKGMAVLMHYSWPGNVRELRNTLYNVLSLNDEPELTATHFRNLTGSPNFRTVDFFSQEMSIDEYARMFVLNRQGQYNDSQLAKILGFSRKTLWEKRKKWNLFRA